MHKKKVPFRVRHLSRRVALILALILGLSFGVSVSARPSLLPGLARPASPMSVSEVSRGLLRQPPAPAQLSDRLHDLHTTSVQVDPTATWSLDPLSVPQTPLPPPPAPVFAADDTSAYSTSPAAEALRAHRRMIEQGGNYKANNSLAATFVGAYGFHINTWMYYCRKTGTNPSDFSPAHQDQLANALVVDSFGGNWANVPKSGGW